MKRGQGEAKSKKQHPQEKRRSPAQRYLFASFTICTRFTLGSREQWSCGECQASWAFHASPRPPGMASPSSTEESRSSPPPPDAPGTGCGNLDPTPPSSLLPAAPLTELYGGRADCTCPALCLRSWHLAHSLALSVCSVFAE